MGNVVSGRTTEHTLQHIEKQTLVLTGALKCVLDLVLDDASFRQSSDGKAFESSWSLTVNPSKKRKQRGDLTPLFK